MKKLVLFLFVCSLAIGLLALGATPPVSSQNELPVAGSIEMSSFDEDITCFDNGDGTVECSINATDGLHPVFNIK